MDPGFTTLHSVWEAHCHKECSVGVCVNLVMILWVLLIGHKSWGVPQVLFPIFRNCMPNSVLKRGDLLQPLPPSLAKLCTIWACSSCLLLLLRISTPACCGQEAAGRCVLLIAGSLVQVCSPEACSLHLPASSTVPSSQLHMQLTLSPAMPHPQTLASFHFGNLPTSAVWGHCHVGWGSRESPNQVTCPRILTLGPTVNSPSNRSY